MMITYQLYIRLSSPCHITVGRLGAFDFPAGRYIYTGSAKKNFEARIARHLRREKKLRWHIDYLLSHPYADIDKVMRHSDSECLVNQRVNGCIVIEKFGATDCKSGCGSHLKLLENQIKPLTE